MNQKLANSYDILGISSATLCLIHCILLPLLTIIPFGFSDNIYVDCAFAGIGLFAVSKVILNGADKKIRYILGISTVTIIISVTLELLLDINSGLILIGGSGMIVGHYLNYKSHK